MLFIQYNKFDLLELFEQEPLTPAGKEAGIYIFSKTDPREVKLVMSLLVYEKKCEISLTLKDQPIFEVVLENVESLQSEECQLMIDQQNCTSNWIVAFHPFFRVFRQNKEDSN